jgi:hypothetical protein
MKQIIASLLFMYCLSQEEQPPPRVQCHGYQKIAYGVGINCKGDTIKIEEAAEFNRKYYKKTKIK